MTETPVSREPSAVGFTSTDALLGVMALIWGVNFIVVKSAMREIPPLAFNALRYALAAVTLVALARLTGARLPDRADAKRFLMIGLLGHVVYQIGFIEGIARTRAGNAALLMAAVPVQTAVLSHLSGHERLRSRDVLGLLLGVAGITAIVLGSGKAVAFGSTVRGDLIVLVSTVCWSVYAILSKPLADRYGPATLTTWMTLVGLGPLTLVALPSLVTMPWRAISSGAWAGVVYSALGALVVAYFFWTRGIQRLGPARTAMYSNFTPVVAMLAAWGFLHETPTPWQVTGAAGIFTGVWLTRT